MQTGGQTWVISYKQVKGIQYTGTIDDILLVNRADGAATHRKHAQEIPRCFDRFHANYNICSSLWCLSQQFYWMTAPSWTRTAPLEHQWYIIHSRRINRFTGRRSRPHFRLSLFAFFEYIMGHTSIRFILLMVLRTKSHRMQCNIFSNRER